PATNVRVTDILPASLTFVSATASQGTYSPLTAIWSAGTITTATPQTLQIQATVLSSGTETNTASISHSDQFDPDPANNSASGSESPQQSDLSVTKAVSDTTPIVGDTITFTITLSNNGPDSATNVQVTDLLPAGLTFVAFTASQGNYSSTTGIWSAGTITTAAAQILQIQAKVVGPNAQTNTARISDSDQF